MRGVPSVSYPHGARQGVNDMRTKTDDRRRLTVEEVREILDRPKGLVIEDAVAYWLEDDQGQRLCPDSDRTTEPFAKVLDLHRQGRDPDHMRLWARLDTGEHYEVGGGVILLDVAESAAGIPWEERTARQTRT